VEHLKERMQWEEEQVEINEAQREGQDEQEMEEEELVVEEEEEDEEEEESI
jgi:hypothetical protein